MSWRRRLLDGRCHALPQFHLPGLERIPFAHPLPLACLRLEPCMHRARSRDPPLLLEQGLPLPAELISGCRLLRVGKLRHFGIQRRPVSGELLRSGLVCRGLLCGGILRSFELRGALLFLDTRLEFRVLALQFIHGGILLIASGESEGECRAEEKTSLHRVRLIGEAGWNASGLFRSFHLSGGG